MLNQLRKNLILLLIKRNQKKIIRSRTKVSLHQAKKVGMILMIDSQEMLDQVVKMKRTIESYGSKVEGIAFVPSKELPQYFIDQMQVTAFTKKQVNIAGIPGGMVVKDFLNKEYDILIDLSVGEFLPLRYLAGMARAGVKAGKYDESMVHVYDFMIKNDTGNNFGDFLFTMKNYLSKINTTQT